MKLAKTMDKNENIVVTLSGRGDKDVEVVQQYLRIREKEKYDKRPTT
jgi:tryptophan synthase beta chain